MRIGEIRKLNYEELKRELESSRQELFNLRFRAATRQLTNYREINKVKKKIARLNTVIREMELSGS
ncbi:MAG: 50S ribosomal protein L29 [Dehalococcoidia bacterium]|nr:50S ribosomal protein L29 [Dehalococcoidia bacterium]MCL0034334.1 50S ribosomal protein L29 [Dehalococcoidia bacterium]MCL0056002.1 50S ribosomal protein L29 [Dehalococcoidia bacterium]MCL0063677.1 50S ribosomal protein L29 [Dehalococcoidia bacterium]MCL0076804.1 50S ribosomal protein L29 [Dehalococcoidia bacterium]